MTEYCFTLRFELPETPAPIDTLLEKLAEAGCDDALVGAGTAGKLALEFTRQAMSASDAIDSAIRDVQVAIPGAVMIEAAPDFVGLTDVADLIGVSRQNMRKLMLTHSKKFPLPVHDGKTAIWHLADVLEWLGQRNHYQLPAVTCELAQVTRRLNVLGSVQRYGYQKTKP
ncbi:helix-turn-helix transcriptional regulator [Pantoea stewartii]|uniref:helix-turn-helix transcriptional regulator n=1 Tax=Pantoea stewartii TaxID=66269 RepID=UPI00345BCFFC